jgi:hypothetical protein
MPLVYARMGVQEYFAYDPNIPPVAAATTQRLFGWRLDPVSQHMTPLMLRPGGYLWSDELESFLVPGEALLRLYDRNSQLRLTGEEAEAAARRDAERRAEAEIAARRIAEQQAQALAEKLRSLGIDPEQL